MASDWMNSRISAVEIRCPSLLSKYSAIAHRTSAGRNSEPSIRKNNPLRRLSTCRTRSRWLRRITSSDLRDASALSLFPLHNGTIRLSNSLLNFAFRVKRNASADIGICARSTSSWRAFAPVPDTNKSSASGWLNRLLNKSPRILRPVPGSRRHRSAIDQSPFCFCRFTEWNCNLLAVVST